MLSPGSTRPPESANSGHGSSSTLSPLAQPFTVERPLHKPETSPVRDPCFNSPFSYASGPSRADWLHLRPPTTVSDDFSPDFNPIRSNLPSAGSFKAKSCYGNSNSFFPAQTTASSIVNSRSPLSPTSPFPYSPNSEPASNVHADPELYFRQYPSGILDNNVAVHVPPEGSSQTGYFPSESGYGMSSSVVIPSDVSSRADYGYATTKWKGLWSRQFDGEQDQTKALGGVVGEFSWKEKPIASNYGSSVQQGSRQHQSGSASPAEGFIASEESSSVWHGKHNEYMMRQTPFGLNAVGSEHLTAKCSENFLEKGEPSFSVSGTSALIPGLKPQEMPNPLLLDQTYFMESWNPLNPNSVPIDRSFMHLDSCTTDPAELHPSMANFPPTQVHEPLAGGASALKDPKNTGGYVSASLRWQPSVQLDAKSKEGYGCTSRISDDESMKEVLPSKNALIVNHPSNDSSKGKFESTASHTNLSNTFIFTCGAAGLSDCVQSSSEMFDQLIPAIDSPCWKGAPSSRCSPFGISDVDPLSQENQLEELNNLEQCHLILPVNDESDAAVVSSPKLYGSLLFHETGRSNGPLVSFPKETPFVFSSPQAEHKLASADKSKKGLKDLTVGDCTCSNGIQESRNYYLLTDFPKNSSEVNVSDTMLNTSKAKVTSDWTDFKGATQDISLDFMSQHRETVSNSTSSGMSVSIENVGPLNALPDALSESLIPRIDSRMLIKTMHNLSELLLSVCQSNANALKENDFSVLELVMDNLSKCVPKKAGLLRPASGSSSQSSSYHQKLTDPCKDTTIGKYSVVGAENRNLPSLNRDPVNTEGAMHSIRTATKIDNLHNFASVSEEMDIEENNGMAQEIEKVLHRNFREQEDKHPRTILYRDLWFKAEASLCFMKYQLRLAQMKIEMEKHKQETVKGNLGSGTMEPESVIDPQEAKRLNASMKRQLRLIQTKIEIEKHEQQVEKGNLGAVTVELEKPLNPEEAQSLTAKGASTENVSTAAEDYVQSMYDQEDVESSVMARFRVLKHRIDNLNSASEEMPLLLPDLGAQEKFLSQFHPEGKFKAGTERPIKVVDVGFPDRRQWPFVRDEQNADGTGICLEELDEQERAREVCTSDSLPWLPFNILGDAGNRVVPIGSESPCSESGNGWEHVPKEELAW